MVYFTSDLHLGHNAVIRMQKRPFVNAEEMNRILIDNYNSMVHQAVIMIKSMTRGCLKRLEIL